MSRKYICIHAHFYQPPRENPWTQEIEIQDSAAPYKNWNKRITEECYAPNAKARILDEDLRIKKIVNNYSRISFNFSPTLLSWLESNSPETYQAILDADKESQKLFSGHGSALAQPYYHMIMPLAKSSDKLTQIIWGIEDFKLRFKREPVGVWLPETAVDIETLDFLANEGIRFTVLAPGQAKKIRSSENSNWMSVNEETLDTTRPYKQKLPSGREISIFFYNKNVSHQVAFENLLSNGDKFFNNLISQFSTDSGKTELVHPATDGESYGHHHKFGEMTLAYTLDRLMNHDSYSLVNYSKYLADYPATWEVGILENTSWSCAHGIERWRSDCGCHTGGEEGWTQAWRKPLREALDELREQLDKKFEETLNPLLKNPSEARNEFVQLILHTESVEKFLGKHASFRLDASKKIKVLKWMEIQRHAMLMYTSCGWFFNDVSGIETVQILRYASYALDLYSQLDGVSLESSFIETLKKARSNIPKWKSGDFIYKKMVESTRVANEQIFTCGLAANLLKKSILEIPVGSNSVLNISSDKTSSGKYEIIFGKGDIVKDNTLEKVSMDYFVLHDGDGDYKIFVLPSVEKNKEIREKILSVFEKKGYKETLSLLLESFGPPCYPDRKIFHKFYDNLADEIGQEFWAKNRNLKKEMFSFQKNLLLLHNRLDTPLPSDFDKFSGFFLIEQWKEILNSPENSLEKIQHLIKFSNGNSLDTLEFKSIYQERIKQVIKDIEKHPEDMEKLDCLNSLLGLLDFIPMKLNLWNAQNEVFKKVIPQYMELKKRKSDGEQNVDEWVDKIESVLNYLNISKKVSL
ncbi:MAG: DUF3536 domain-containing protein [Nitrospinota bacterium]